MQKEPVEKKEVSDILFLLHKPVITKQASMC